MSTMAAPDFGGDPRAIGIAGQRGDVVDDPGAGFHRLAHDGRVAGVDRDDRAGLGQRPHHRQDARRLFLRRHRLRARPGGFATDVDDVGAGRQHGARVVDGMRGFDEIAAVGEAVGRHVDDTHDQRPLEVEAGPMRPRRGESLDLAGRKATRLGRG
jgi:hypothetical protein